MEEIWKYVSGFDKSYSVSNFGNVKSHARHCEVRMIRRNNNVRRNESWMRCERILKPIINKGTLYVHLYHLDHTRDSIPVKRLVAEAFMEGFDYSIPTCNILLRDGDPSNCKIDNLYIRPKQ